LTIFGFAHHLNAAVGRKDAAHAGA